MGDPTEDGNILIKNKLADINHKLKKYKPRSENLVFKESKRKQKRFENDSLNDSKSKLIDVKVKRNR